MGSEWNRYKLGDITEWKSGGTPAKSNEDYWNGEIPWISASSMDGNRYNNSKLKITKLGLKGGSKLALANSILLLVRGSILHQKIQVGIAECDVAFNQDVKALNANEEIIEPWYLLLWFMSKKNELLNLVENTGIGAGKLDTKVLQNLTVLVPPKAERDKIVAFIKAIDDKIELNRQMNETLEAMAQALFKSWFVDFDPVLDNAITAGNTIPDAMLERAAIRKQVLAEQTQSNPYAKHFPSEFEFTDELGWIPRGWENGSASLLAELNSESLTKKKLPSDVSYVDLSSAKNGRINEITNYNIDDAPSRAKRVLKPHDTIVGTVRPKNKSFAYVFEKGLIGSTGFAVMRPKLSQYRAFIYFLITQDVVIQYFSHIADGGAYPAIRPEVVSDLKTAIPTNEMFCFFEENVSKLLMKISINETQNINLSKLRDTLLPQLLSGKRCVADAEKMVAELGL